MFRTFFRLTLLGIFLSGWGMASLSLHFVRTPGKLALLPKERLGFTDTFVDARKWTLSDLQAHPDLARRIVESNMCGLFQYLGSADQIYRSASQAAPQQSAFNNIKGLLPPQVQAANGFDGLSFPVEF